MDQIDHSILNIMKLNGRISASEISKRVNLSIPAVTERIRKLEESQMIEHYDIRINRNKMGLKLLTMILLTLDRSADIEHFREEVVQLEEVIECHHIAGEYDYMLKVLINDTAELETFLSKKLKGIEGVQRSNSLIVLSTLKEVVNR